MKGNLHTPCVMTDTDQFYVRVCGCGVVHLSFGATTLNLSEDAVVAVTETLKEISKGFRRRVNPSELTSSQASTGAVIVGKFPQFTNE